MRGGEKVIVRHRKTPGGPLYTDVGVVAANTATANGRRRFTLATSYVLRPVQIKAELVELIYRPSEQLYRELDRWLRVCAGPTRGALAKRKLREAHRAFVRAVAFECRGVQVADVDDAWRALAVRAAEQIVDG